MARAGVLSDTAVKLHCPEMFPLPSSQYKLFHPTILPTNKLTGVKPELRFRDYQQFARFPDNDFRNFGNINAVNNRETAALNAIYNYRNQIGSQNLHSAVNITNNQPPITQLSQLIPTGTTPTPSSESGDPLVPTLLRAASQQSREPSFQRVSAQIDLNLISERRERRRMTPEQRSFGRLEEFVSNPEGQSFRRFLTRSAQAYLGAFPEDTRNNALAHFADPMRRILEQQQSNLPTQLISADDVHRYLLAQNPNPTQRQAMVQLLNDEKRVQASQASGSSIPGAMTSAMQAARSRFLGGFSRAQVEQEIAEEEESD
jgi:hypothetical protein